MYTSYTIASLQGGDVDNNRVDYLTNTVRVTRSPQYELKTYDCGNPCLSIDTDVSAFTIPVLTGTWLMVTLLEVKLAHLHPRSWVHTAMCAMPILIR